MTTESPTPASPEFYLDQALAAFERARALVDADAEPGLHGVVLHDIARIYESTGRAAEALDLYRRSAAAKRLGSPPDDLEVTLRALAMSLLEHAEFTEAREVVDEAAGLLSRPGMEISPSGRASRAHGLAVLYERLGDYGEEGAHLRALETFEWSLSLLDEHADPGSCAAVLQAVARVQCTIGREQEATTSLAEAIRFYTRDGDVPAQVGAYIDLGRLYGRLAETSHLEPYRSATPADEEETDTAHVSGFLAYGPENHSHARSANDQESASR